MVSLVTICDHTKLLQYYWVYSSCCILNPITYFILNARLYLLSTCLFQPSLHPYPSNHKLILCINVSFLFCLIICFAFWIPHITDSHTTLVFLVWHIPLSIIPSRSICAAASRNLSFFHGWITFHCVCRWNVCVCIYIHKTDIHTHVYVKHVFFIHSSIGWYPGCFQILAIYKLGFNKHRDIYIIFN